MADENLKIPTADQTSAPVLSYQTATGTDPAWTVGNQKLYVQIPPPRKVELLLFRLIGLTLLSLFVFTITGVLIADWWFYGHSPVRLDWPYVFYLLLIVAWVYSLRGVINIARFGHLPATIYVGEAALTIQLTRPRGGVTRILPRAGIRNLTVRQKGSILRTTDLILLVETLDELLQFPIWTRQDGIADRLEQDLQTVLDLPAPPRP